MKSTLFTIVIVAVLLWGCETLFAKGGARVDVERAGKRAKLRKKVAATALVLRRNGKMLREVRFWEG